MERWWPFGRTPPEEPIRLPPDPADWSIEDADQRELLLPLLMQELQSPMPSHRARAVELLVRAAPDAAVPELVNLLRREDHLQVRWKALHALEQLSGAAAEPPSAEEVTSWRKDLVVRLLEQLHSEQASQRWTAAEGLGTLRDPRAVPALVEAIADPHAFVRWAAAQALGQIGGKKAVPLLLPLLQNEDALVRRGTVDALGYFDQPAARKALRESLRDPDPTVRRNAVEAIARLGDSTAVESLTVALSPQNDLWLRYSAAEALATVGDHRAIPPLIEASQDPQVLLRRVAVRALGLLHDSRAIPALLQAMNDRDPQVRLHAADGLGRIGHSGVIPRLKPYMRDSGRVFGQTVGEAVRRAIELLQSRSESTGQETE